MQICVAFKRKKGRKREAEQRVRRKNKKTDASKANVADAGPIFLKSVILREINERLGCW